MSTIGKVLVVLVLILSVAFLASSIFVLNKQEDFRHQLEAEQALHKKDSTERDAKITDIETRLEQRRQSLSERDNEVASLKTDRDSLASRLKTEEGYRNSTSENINKINTSLENFRQNADTLSKQVEDLRKQADGMRGERDAAKKSQEDAENRFAQSDEGGKQLTAQVNSLMAQVKKLSEDGAMKDNALAVYAERTGIQVAEVYQAPPSITGNVVTVASEAKLIQLNVGSDAKVKAGYGFTIYRGSEYKGECIVTDVQAKFATARIMSMVRPITVGDQAKAGIF